MKRLFDILGLTALVLLLSAFDEGRVEHGFSRARSGMETAWTRLSKPMDRSTPPAFRADGHLLQGRFAMEGSDAVLNLDGPRLEISGVGVIQTRPHRIALGHETPLAALKAPADRQIELREIVGHTPDAAGPPDDRRGLCQGRARYLAIEVEPETGAVHILAFTAPPADPARPCAERRFTAP